MLLQFSMSLRGEPGDAPQPDAGVNANVHVALRDAGASSWTQGSVFLAATGASYGSDIYFPNIVWTGTECLMWFSANSMGLPFGARYNPSTDTWKPMATTGGPSCLGCDGNAFWGSGVMCVGLSYQYDPATDGWSQASSSCVYPTNPGIAIAASVRGERFGLGKAPVGMSFELGAYAYDPAARTWTAKSLVGAPMWSDTTRNVYYGVSANQDLIVSAEDVQPGEVSAYRYDTAADRWSPVSYRPAWLALPITGRSADELIATGDKLLHVVDATHIYVLDPVSGIWGIAPPMPFTGLQSAGAFGSSGAAYGYGYDGSSFAHVFAFTPPAGPLTLQCN